MGFKKLTLVAHTTYKIMIYISYIFKHSLCKHIEKETRIIIFIIQQIY